LGALDSIMGIAVAIAVFIDLFSQTEPSLHVTATRRLHASQALQMDAVAKPRIGFTTRRKQSKDRSYIGRRL